MDGQQRLTSLYQAFSGKGEHQFFIDIETLMETDDVEEAIWHEPSNRANKKGYNSINMQAERLWCPLSVVMTKGFDAWIDEVMEIRPEKGDEAKELRSSLRKVKNDWIEKIRDYQFPVVTLASDTPLDAVCKMFETLNRRGVKLTVFELLMARAFMSKVSLRDMWDKANNDYPILGEFKIDAYQVLQAISLISGKSLKRQEILEMPSDVISQHWDNATRGISESLTFLRRNTGVLSINLLPYHTMIPPMASAWIQTENIKGPASGNRTEKFKSWFWSSVFSQTYEKSPTSVAVADYKDLTAWINGNERTPRGIRALYFSPDTFFTITPKQRALYRGTLALITSNGARDFHKLEPLTFDYLESNKVDDHHIFPRAHLKRSTDTEENMINCVLNRTLIDKKTNQIISDNRPSKYLTAIKSELNEEKLKKVLTSHLIPMPELMGDDFESFCNARAKFFMKNLNEAVGFEIPSTPTTGSENQSDFDDEDSDDRTDKRQKTDPSLVNVRPEEKLQKLPPQTGEFFDLFTKRLLEKLPSIWWKTTQTRSSVYSPIKKFASIKVERSGLHLTIFTNGNPMEHVTPIVQSDGGGALWGRIKVKSIADIEKAITATIEAHKRIQEAEKTEIPTSWWAKKR
jgi:hypothetical protein